MKPQTQLNSDGKISNIFVGPLFHTLSPSYSLVLDASKEMSTVLYVVHALSIPQIIFIKTNVDQTSS